MLIALEGNATACAASILLRISSRRGLGSFVTQSMTPSETNHSAASVGVNGKQFIHPRHYRGCSRVSGIQLHRLKKLSSGMSPEFRLLEACSSRSGVVVFGWPGRPPPRVPPACRPPMNGSIPTQRNPIELVTVKGASKRMKQPRSLNVEEFQRFVKHLYEPFRTMALCAAVLVCESANVLPCAGQTLTGLPAS
jgi:hypothetical protein